MRRRSAELEFRRHQTIDAPSRPPCDCGDAWYVHASQVRDAGKRYAGDCASCAQEDRVCYGYTPAVTTSVAGENPDGPPIPDDVPMDTPSEREADGETGFA